MSDTITLKTIETTVVGGIVKYLKEKQDSFIQKGNENTRAEEEAENLSVDVDNVYCLQIPDQVKACALKNNQYSAYTSAQIERMREEIAYADTNGDETKFVENLQAMNREEPDISSGDFSTDHSQIISLDEAVSWVEESVSNRIFSDIDSDQRYDKDCVEHAENGWMDINIGEAGELDGKTSMVIANNWSIQPSTITNDSSEEEIKQEYELINNARKDNALPDSIIDQMRVFVAEADEVAGNGTYEMNYQAMLEGSYQDDIYMYADADSQNADVKRTTATTSDQPKSREDMAEEVLGDSINNIDEIDIEREYEG